MNKVIIMGRLTKDPEIRYNAENKGVARAHLAVDRSFKKDNGPSADFIPLVAFGKTAEFLEKYGRKGTKFAVVGRINTGSYENKEGQTVYTWDVIVENIEFAESKRNDGSNDIGSAPAGPVPSDDGFLAIPDGIEEDGLPFA